MQQKLADQAALRAVESNAGLVDTRHQFGGRFEGDQLLWIPVNVNGHAVLSVDDTVLPRRKTLVYDWDLSDAWGDLAQYALLTPSGCRG